jgi:hypothetical protein
VAASRRDSLSVSPAWRQTLSAFGFRLRVPIAVRRAAFDRSTAFSGSPSASSGVVRRVSMNGPLQPASYQQIVGTRADTASESGFKFPSLARCGGPPRWCSVVLVTRRLDHEMRLRVDRCCGPLADAAARKFDHRAPRHARSRHDRRTGAPSEPQGQDIVVGSAPRRVRIERPRLRARRRALGSTCCHGLTIADDERRNGVGRVRQRLVAVKCVEITHRERHRGRFTLGAAQPTQCRERRTPPSWPW